MLSDLARIFDPLGFLTPLTLYLKFIIQQLWARNTDWDSPRLMTFLTFGLNSNRNFLLSRTFHIPRHIIPESYIALELHGFCDASSRGYSAVIYLRSTLPSGKIQVNFICAKSKVAPLKSISIPRLELCSALLLSELMNFVLSLFEDHITISKVYAWSDSTITLAWINSSPHRWGTFVCNRVTKIHENVPSSIWRHISSQDNPADPASRGLLPSALISNSLLFSGPRWLSMSSEYWPTLSDIPETDEEKHHVTLLSVENQTPSKNTLSELIEKYSSLSKIQRILAYILRFLHNLKHAQAKQSGYLSRSELENSLTLLIKNVQEEEFSTEIYRLKSQRPLQRTFKKLTPFLDKSGVLRVGGRLMHLLAQCISDYFGLSQLQCTSVTPAGISASEGKHPRAYRPWEIAAYGKKTLGMILHHKPRYLIRLKDYEVGRKQWHIRVTVVDLDRSVNEINIHAITNLVEADRRLTVEEIAAEKSFGFVKCPQGGPHVSLLSNKELSRKRSVRGFCLDLKKKGSH
ncbi:hypothetical protein NQ318_006960 [Aromia moschata]|uniref:Maturase n=1 Tax=Aromia moschata TaxID=1265417 RepID=A0AAV8Y8I0_9CUCU|nr:hypothetical protein NQ318_006960 [Aromia moschata]